MPEAITKYAINSTLGTDDFEPLDKIIKGQKTIVASEKPLVTLWASNDENTFHNDDTIVSFRANTSGTAKLSVYGYNPTPSKTASIVVEINGVNYTVLNLTSAVASTLLSSSFSVKKGDVMNIKVSSGYDGITLKDITLCADVMDGSLVTVL
jgi:hypothetical protein